jgi:heme exporter protein A
MLEAKTLECIRGNRRLFANLSFSVRPGDSVQLTGANGSGKTSLLRLLCGLMQPSSGEIHWDGKDIRVLGEEYNAVFTYLGHRHGVKDELTSIENLRVSCGMSGTELAFDEATQVLERVGLGGFELHPARLLSDGLRRRLALGRLLACGARLWLLDETLAALDSSATAWMTRVMDDQLAGGGMIVVATHQELRICSPFHRLQLPL